MDKHKCRCEEELVVAVTETEITGDIKWAANILLNRPRTEIRRRGTKLDSRYVLFVPRFNSGAVDKEDFTIRWRMKNAECCRGPCPIQYIPLTSDDFFATDWYISKRPAY